MNNPVAPAADNTSDRRGSTRALVLGTLGFAACFYAWALLGPLGPDLQDEAGLSDFQLSAVVAIPVLLGSLLRIPIGAVTDRVGGRRAFIWMLLFTPLPLIALAVFHGSFAALAILGLFLGVAGASFAIGAPFVSGWYPPHRQGAMLGIYGAGMGGTVLAGLTAPTIAKEFGLAAPFLVATVLVLIVAVVFFMQAEDAAPPTGSSKIADSLAPFRNDCRAWALTIFYFLTFGGFVAMFLYLPKLLTGDDFGLDKADAGARAAGFALLAVLGRPAGGILSDRIGAIRVLQISFVAIGVFAAGLAVAYDSMVPLTICCLALAVFLGLGMGATFKLVAKWFPDKVGGVTGVVGAAGGLGGFFPPLLLGIINTETGSYTLGFILLAALAAACLLVIAWLGNRDSPFVAGPAGP